METTVGSGKPPYNLQDVGSSSWEVKKPTSTGDCEDEDNDVEEVLEYYDTDVAAVVEQDKLANFEMEATISSWEMEEPMSTGDCEDDNDDDEEVVDTDTVEEQDELSDLEMGETVGSGKPPYKLPARIFNKLYAHQREGLSWLWSLHCRETGGIIGDEMGLGKTMQVHLFLLPIHSSSLRNLVDHRLIHYQQDAFSPTSCSVLEGSCRCLPLLAKLKKILWEKTASSFSALIEPMHSFSLLKLIDHRLIHSNKTCYFVSVGLFHPHTTY
jgi:hypothetical protein